MPTVVETKSAISSASGTDVESAVRVQFVGEREIVVVPRVSDLPAGVQLVTGQASVVALGPKGIVVAPSERWMSSSIERDTVWHQRRELLKLLGPWVPELYTVSASVRCDALLALVTALNQVRLGGASVPAVLQSYVRNSHRRDVSVLRRMLADDEPMPTGGFPTDDSHTPSEQFGWIYATQARLVQATSNANGRAATVVDIGSGAGYFAFALAAVLPAPAVQFVCVDRDMRDGELLASVAPNNPHDIRRVVADVTSETFEADLGAALDGAPVDVIVANHLLEHLHGARPAHWISRWLRVAPVVSVSVPMWDRLTHTVSTHIEEYTPDTLAQVARAVAEQCPGVRVDDRGLVAGLLTFHAA